MKQAFLPFISGVVVSGVWCFLWGYGYGRKLLFQILRIHCRAGMPFGEALDYEEAISKGKKPWAAEGKSE